MERDGPGSERGRPGSVGRGLDDVGDHVCQWHLEGIGLTDCGEEGRWWHSVELGTEIWVNAKRGAVEG